ncbi:hypothetical protein [Rickettsiella endosymbiont of Aleochara curtula]|uniref:hypothetical protein n=1 Tax=Rickettsiella endosymbiont of Aleochara curtula TaxID=3077936 RepID=UPI00313CE2D5
MKKVKHVTFQIQTNGEQSTGKLSNLEQLDDSEIVTANQNTEKILQLKTRIAQIVIKVDHLKASLLIFIAAKDTMKKLDGDKNDPFTKEDINAEIKLINRQIHHYGYVKLKNEVKIEMLSTQEIYLEPEAFERRLLELRLQERETGQVIQNLESAINALKRMLNELSKNFSKSWEDFLIKGYVNRQIQLLKKEESENKAKLENIEGKIKTLKEPKSIQDTFLAASQAKLLFFNGKAGKDNCTTQAELKHCTL